MDLVKIDGLFIRQLAENQLNQTIVIAICEIRRVVGRVPTEVPMGEEAGGERRAGCTLPQPG